MCDVMEWCVVAEQVFGVRAWILCLRISSLEKEGKMALDCHLLYTSYYRQRAATSAPQPLK
jgi:hypothetical protein